MKHKLESRLLEEIINNFRYADNNTLMAQSKEELKSLLMKVKKESEEVGFKFNIQKTKIMASSPITSWQYMGKQWRTLFLGGSKAMAPHSSTLAWKIPWTEEPGGLQSMGSHRVGHDRATSLWLFLSCIGEGNGNPLQCSCLENPRDGGAWWVAVYAVAQSRTLLKRLSSSSKINAGGDYSHEIKRCLLLRKKVMTNLYTAY